MAETAATRDALLADVGRALRTALPERAEQLLQELEYATGKDTRPVVEVAGMHAAETEILGAILAAANRVEARLPWGRRVTWLARVTPIVDTTVVLLGVEAEPVDERTHAAVLASFFASAFAPEMAALAKGGLEVQLPEWFFSRLRKLTQGGDVDTLVTTNVVGLIAPGVSASALPPAPARFSIVPLIAPALRECFPARAEAILDGIWGLLVVAVPRAKAIRHDGGAPGRTPRELALQMVDLMNAVEAEQPEPIRAAWSAAPAAGGAVEIRGVPAP